MINNINVMLVVASTAIQINTFNEIKADSLPDDYVNTSFLRYENYIYKNYIRTVELYRDGDEMSFPSLLKGGDGKLVLNFDDLEGGVKNYYYTVIHCDMDWNPTALLPSYYIDGLQEDRIFNYKYSFHTLQHYTHYRLEFPNEVMKPSLSGNYILLVYMDNDRENIVLTRRFLVYEEQVAVQGRIIRPMDIDSRKYYQEVDFSVNTGNYPVSDPYNELEAFIMQNHRWDNMKCKIKPSLLKDKELLFDYNSGNTFGGGNEYRRFDIRSLRFKSERIRQLEIDTVSNRVFLYADEKRAIKLYYPDMDYNGQRFIRIQEGSDDATEADYAWVHFRLVCEQPLTDGNIYVFGALSDWRCHDEFKMKYDYAGGGYEAVALLKQGLYNYEYVLLKSGTSAADNSIIEGNHYETGNDYTIIVYHHDFINNYDRLIGIKELNSKRDF